MNSDIQVSPDTIETMKSTRTWTGFMAIMGFICSGLMILMGLGMMVGGSMMGGMTEGAPVGAMGIMYILMSLIYVVPSIFLMKYSSSIGTMLSSQRLDHLETALAHQKSFWKFVGIFTMVMTVISVVGIVAALIIPILAS